MNKHKLLVAYYSYSGNTKAVAKKIQNITKADLFEIIPQKPYSKDYNSVVAQAKDEKLKNYMPELTEDFNISKYNIIFLGTPVWWYTIASPVRTFLGKNNFERKIIVPFCTHGGGGASTTYADMQKLAQKAIFMEGFTSYENSAKDDDIKNWLKNLDLKF